MVFKIIIGDMCIFMEQQKKGNSSTKNRKLIKLVSNLTDYLCIKCKSVGTEALKCSQ